MVSFFVADDTVLVADGGLATELEARGNDLSDSLWSARLLMDAPEQIRDAHLAFFRAGAVIATSASYQATFEGFARRGFDRRDEAGLMRRSMELARAAARDRGRAGRVGGRLGRPVWCDAGGRVSTGTYGLRVRELAACHRPRIEALAAAGPEVLALETVPDTDEAEALLIGAADGCGVPVWLSYSIAGERTRAGQPLADAFRAGRRERFRDFAVGINCCEPGDTDRAVEMAASVYGQAGRRLSEQRGGVVLLAARGWRGEAPRSTPLRLRSWQSRGGKAGRRVLPGRGLRRSRRSPGPPPTLVRDTPVRSGKMAVDDAERTG